MIKISINTVIYVLLPLRRLVTYRRSELEVNTFHITPNPFQDTNTVDVTPVASSQLLQDARHLDRDRRAKENIEVDKPVYRPQP